MSRRGGFRGGRRFNDRGGGGGYRGGRGRPQYNDFDEEEQTFERKQNFRSRSRNGGGDNFQKKDRFARKKDESELDDQMNNYWNKSKNPESKANYLDNQLGNYWQKNAKQSDDQTENKPKTTVILGKTEKNEEEAKDVSKNLERRESVEEAPL